MRHIGVALFLLVGCTETEVATNEVGITYTAVQADVVAGTFDTQYGSVQFDSRVTSDGVVDVTFARGELTFGSHVDWNALKVDLMFEEGHEVTHDDRFLMKALVTALENDLDEALPAADNLIRQANVWGHHPEGAMVLRTIAADPERGWTKLCNVNAYTFNHDAWSHGQQYEYLACGLYETSNPCRDRCGPGCTAWWGTSAWTKDCGDHDRCEQKHNTVNCGDEFARASDDFSFAGNCSY